MDLWVECFSVGIRQKGTVFRKRISEAIIITEWHDLLEAERQLEDQIRQIEELRPEFQHSISLCKKAKRGDPSTYKYTCYMYAFDLMDHRILKDIARGATEIYPRAEFVTFLISNLLVELDINEVQDGDFVVYFNEGMPVHAGKWRQGLVTSKWGEYGHLWQHGICEVPTEYGDSAQFFEKLPNIKVEKFYRRWAESILAT